MQPPDEKSANISTAKNPLVLIGASVRAAAQSAQRADFDVFGIDYFGDSDAQAACHCFFDLSELGLGGPEEIGRLLAASSKRAIPLMVVGEMHSSSPSVVGADGADFASVMEAVLQEVRQSTRRIGATPAIAQALKDPDVLARIAIRARAHFPAYRREVASDDSAAVSNATAGLSTTSTASATHAADVPGRWLAKSLCSSGGLGVRWVDGQSDARPDTSQMRQLWHSGRSYGASFLSDGEQAVLLGTCRSLFTAKRSLRYVYAGSYGPIRQPQVITRQLLAIGQQAVLQTGLTGLFNVDVLVDRDDKVTLLEINPRWSASMECIERSLVHASHSTHGPSDSLVAWAVDATQSRSLAVNQRRIDSTMHDGPRILKRILYAERSGTFDPSVLESINTGEGSGFDAIEFCDVPADGASIDMGQPLLSVVCRQGFRKNLSWRKTKRLFASLQKAVVS